MRLLTSFVALVLLATPVYNAYALNTSVSHIRDDPEAVPFFAFYRYGFVQDSVVFNINSDNCTSVIDDVIPTFRAFVTTLQSDNPREIRLAWQGETLAVVRRSAMESIWHETAWTGAYALETLDAAIQCTPENELYFDWYILTAPATAVI